MKKSIPELIIKEIVDKYNNQKILKNKLKKKSKTKTYSICLNNKNEVHVFEEIYIKELQTYLKKDMTALCNNKFIDLKDVASGMLDKEVKHLLCLFDIDNIKVCSDCISKLYK